MSFDTIEDPSDSLSDTDDDDEHDFETMLGGTSNEESSDSEEDYDRSVKKFIDHSCWSVLKC